MTSRRIAFEQIAIEAARCAEPICHRWLADGRREGCEWVARNPTRSDRQPGSFKVNLNNGRWSDFATGDRGGDLVSLAAYLFRLDQRQAALRVAEMLGIEAYER